jgi:hypothetical protein
MPVPTCIFWANLTPCSLQSCELSTAPAEAVLAAIGSLDRAAFGADRSLVIQALFRRSLGSPKPLATLAVARRRGGVVGFGISLAGEPGGLLTLGPVVAAAAEPDLGAGLVAALIRAHGARRSPTASPGAEVGLGRTVASHYCAPTSHQIRPGIRCPRFSEAATRPNPRGRRRRRRPPWRADGRGRVCLRAGAAWVPAPAVGPGARDRASPDVMVLASFGLDIGVSCDFL